MARANAAALAAGLEDETPEPTLREQLLEARDEVVGNQETQDGGQGQQVRSGAESGSEERAGRERDQSGRFAPKPRDQTPAAEPAKVPAAGASAPTAAQDDAAGKPVPQTDAQADLNLAPRLWSQAAKAEWAKLPETVRREIATREQAMHRQFTAQDGERQLARTFNQTVGQFQDVIQREGVQPVKFMENALSTIRGLQTGSPVQKATILGQLARQYGIDPRIFAGATPGGAPAAPGGAGTPAPAPSFQLPPEIARVASEWDQFKAQQAQQAQLVQEQMAASVMTEIQAFQSNPAHKYFDAVKDHMQVLLAGGAAQTLAEAYDQAIYARPDIRDQIFAERDQAAKAAAEKARQVQQARNRGVSVRGRGGSAASTTPAGDRSLREELQANFAEARSRV